MAIKIGLVGAGAAGELHAKAITKVSGAQLVAVNNRSPDRGKRFARKWNLDFIDSYRAMLAMADLDLIDICTPTGTHASFAIPAAESGKHLIVEKPLEVNSTKCDAIINAAKENGVYLSVIFQNRFKDNVQTARSAVEENLLGKQVLGEAEVKWFRSEEYYRDNWKGALELDGGGALINQSIHTIDLLQWFMGEVNTVFGRTKTLARDIEGEDLGVAILEFANGSLGLIAGSTVLYPGLDERLGIYGTAGTIELEGSQITTWELANEAENLGDPVPDNATNDKSGASEPTDIESENHRRQLQKIIDRIGEGKKPPVPGTEAKKSVRIIEAIYESSSNGKAVYL